MTPQEALAQALQAVWAVLLREYPDNRHDILPSDAAAILDALRKSGYIIASGDLMTEWMEDGAQQERERLRNALDAVRTWPNEDAPEMFAMSRLRWYEQRDILALLADAPASDQQVTIEQALATCAISAALGDDE
jgi:hypothetical protein